MVGERCGRLLHSGSELPSIGQLSREGRGLHTGAFARLTLTRRPGPVALGYEGVEAPVACFEPVSSARSTVVALPGGLVRLATVEHLFAALGGLGIRDGVGITLSGSRAELELPILDGGASAWCAALLELGVEAGEPGLTIAAAGVVEVGESRYAFEPGPGVHVHVQVDFDDLRIAREASWRGDPRDFVSRIAPARTFALGRDLAMLAQRGLARHVPPEAVVFVAEDAIHCAGAPFTPDEPARHKLLDLIGDSYLWGGPAVGTLTARRPGHAANARAFVEAIARGILRRA